MKTVLFHMQEAKGGFRIPNPSHSLPVPLSHCPTVPLSHRLTSLRAGFTLVEMLTVILIIGILAAACLGIFQQARTTAWKQKARDTARQIATAWNVRLMDDHAFPAISLFQSYGTPYAGAFPTTAANMSTLNSNAANRIYLEQNASQHLSGMTDKWGNYYYVRLDVTYSGTVLNPIDNTTLINGNVVVWSLGPSPANPSSSFCIAWQ